MFVWNAILTENENLVMIKIHVYNVMQIYFLIHLHKCILQQSNVLMNII